MKTLTTEELLRKMQNIVNRTLKGYKTDFSEHDYPQIIKLSEAGKDVQFMWIVRELGTHIVMPDENEYLNAIRLNHSGGERYKEYDVTFAKGKWTINKRK